MGGFQLLPMAIIFDLNLILHDMHVRYGPSIYLVPLIFIADRHLAHCILVQNSGTSLWTGTDTSSWL